DARPNGKIAWEALVGKYDNSSKQRRRILMRQLDNIEMSPAQDSDVFLTKVYELRDQLVYMGEPISDERLTDIVVEGSTDDYDRIKYDAERDPDFSISDIGVTMRNMYSNRVARGILSKRVRGRDSAMIATSSTNNSSTPTRFAGKCFSCGKPGHHMRDCRSKRQSNSSDVYLMVTMFS
ncbi:unnamed protein product, partial [Sphacelaria rigidula]